MFSGSISATDKTKVRSGYVIFSKYKINKHNPELPGADHGTKVTGPYFPTQCPKWIFIIPIVLVEKKTY